VYGVKLTVSTGCPIKYSMLPALLEPTVTMSQAPMTTLKVSVAVMFGEKSKETVRVTT